MVGGTKEKMYMYPSGIERKNIYLVDAVTLIHTQSLDKCIIREVPFQQVGSSSI